MPNLYYFTKVLLLPMTTPGLHRLLLNHCDGNLCRVKHGTTRRIFESAEQQYPLLTFS